LKTTFVLTPQDGDRLCWRSDVLAGSGTLDDFAALPDVRQAELLLVVPARKTVLREVGFAAHERRLLRKTVPYALEEDLVDDVEAEHFALGPVDGGQVPVAVVDRAWFEGWLQRCAAAGLDVKHAVPELLLLPWQPGSWSLYPQATQWLVRIDRWRGFALEPDSAKLALQLLLDDAGQLPQQLTIFLDDTSDPALQQWQSQLPELLRGIAVLQPANTLNAPSPVALDFLQGLFARRLPWKRWWTQWRIPAMALAIAVVVQFFVAGVQHYRLQKDNLALRQQVEQIYRSVVPAGAVVEPERQLRRKVEAIRGGQGGAVMPLLQSLGSAIAATQGVSIQSLNYVEKQHELRLNIIAPSFRDVEALRTAIEAGGLQAQLIGSNADGEKTRAQLRVAPSH
jgi:general secretion pathway protein L